ncbi:hypothetical protein VitviT2T_005151 [Vitis vinifera]|uniref:Uncharacterized protein n=1 Tax=Vitis vinifera TaxID=29760 RepID=A0ABY9BSU4_VITVI|nr:hypothetical protein VitviT2T_005151 [Vitis vinifera]
MALEKKFALLPSSLVVERLKRKCELPTLRSFSSEKKSQNFGSSTEGLVGSSTIVGSPTRMRSSRRVMCSSFKEKPSSSLNLINLTEGVDILEDFGKSRDPLVERVCLSSTSINYSFMSKGSPSPPSLVSLDSKNVKKWATITIGDNLLPVIKATRCTVVVRDLKFLSEFLDLTVIDKSVGLCYQAL